MRWSSRVLVCAALMSSLTEMPSVNWFFSSRSLREEGVCHVDRQLIFQYKHSQDAWLYCEQVPRGGEVLYRLSEGARLHWCLPPLSDDVFQSVRFSVVHGKKLSFCLAVQQPSLPETFKRDVHHPASNSPFFFFFFLLLARIEATLSDLSVGSLSELWLHAGSYRSDDDVLSVVHCKQLSFLLAV